MKRLLSLLIILLAAGAALYFAQHRDARDAVSSNAVVDVAADLQRDVTRVPMRVTRLSDADEVRIGDELARRYGLSTAPQTPEMSSAQDHINQVGARVAAHARRKLLFHFYLDPSPDFINAFALPGGHVVVGLGLINQMKSEDEGANGNSNCNLRIAVSLSGAGDCFCFEARSGLESTASGSRMAQADRRPDTIADCRAWSLRCNGVCRARPRYANPL